MEEIFILLPQDKRYGIAMQEFRRALIGLLDRHSAFVPTHTHIYIYEVRYHAVFLSAPHIVSSFLMFLRCLVSGVR